MRDLQNIDKSTFRPGEYIGYAHGVWRVVKVSNSTWRATNRENPLKSLTARTLTDLSALLAKVTK
jgi:hypothetical protein